MQKFQCVEAIIYLLLHNFDDCTLTPFEMTWNSKHRTENQKLNPKIKEHEKAKQTLEDLNLV